MTRTITLAERGGALLRRYDLTSWTRGEAHLSNCIVLRVEELQLGVQEFVTSAEARDNALAIRAWAQSVGIPDYMLMLRHEYGRTPYVVVPMSFFDLQVLPVLNDLHEAPFNEAADAAINPAIKAGAEDPRLVRFARIARRLGFTLAAVVAFALLMVYAGISVDAESGKVAHLIIAAYFAAVPLIAASLYYAQRSAGRSKRRSLVPVVVVVAVLIIALPGSVLLYAQR